MGVRVVLLALAVPVIGGIALGMYIGYTIYENERERERERENQYGRNRSSYASSGRTRRNADGNNETCGICFNQMKDCFQLDCGHKFHTECIIELLLRDLKTCPMCRAGINRQGRA